MSWWQHHKHCRGYYYYYYYYSSTTTVQNITVPWMLLALTSWAQSWMTASGMSSIVSSYKDQAHHGMSLLFFNAKYYSNQATTIKIIFTRDGRIVIFCRIPDSVNRHLISGRFRIRIFDVTLPLVYTCKNYSKSRPMLYFSVIFNRQCCQIIKSTNPSNHIVQYRSQFKI